MTLIAFPPHFIFNIDFSGKLDFRTFRGSTVIFLRGAQSLFLGALLDLITPPPHFVLHYTYTMFLHATDFFFLFCVITLPPFLAARSVVVKLASSAVSSIKQLSGRV